MACIARHSRCTGLKARQEPFSFEYSLCEGEIAYIWQHISAHIANQLQGNKGVVIQGLGTFTVSRRSLDDGCGRYTELSCPVFNLHKQFAQAHDLQFQNCFVPGSTPVLPVNYSTVAYQSQVGRDHVEICAREVIRSVAKAIASSQNVDLCFVGIGRLTFRRGRAKMKFCREFICQMDCSGKLFDSLVNGVGIRDTPLLDSVCGQHAAHNIVVIPNAVANDATPIVLLRKHKKCCKAGNCSCLKKEDPPQCIQFEDDRLNCIKTEHRMTNKKLQRDYYTRMTGCKGIRKKIPNVDVANESVPRALYRVHKKVCAEMEHGTTYFGI